MKNALFLVAICLLPTYARAIPITFDLRTLIAESSDDVARLSVNQGGLTATLSSNTGVINRSSSAVGINSTGGCDNSDELDSACPDTPSERLTVSFDRSVLFQDFSVSGLSNGDAGRLVIALDSGEFRFAFSATGLFTPVFSMPLFIVAGQTFYIESTADNSSSRGKGFSFNSFTVDMPEFVSVSEPKTGIILILALALSAIFRSTVKRQCTHAGISGRPSGRSTARG